MFCSRISSTCIVLILYFVVYHICVEDDCYPRGHYGTFANLQYKACNQNNAFRLLFDLSFMDCVNECQLRARCHGVMYRRVMNMCGLLNNTNTDNLPVEEPVCIFTNVSDWTTKHLGQCSNNTCSITQRCKVNTNGAGKECVTSECLDPPPILNAFLLAKQWTVGNKNAYACNTRYTPEGNPSITCLQDGTWSPTTFVCLKACPRPLPVDNAVLISISGHDFRNGTILHFQCKPGYHMPLGESVTSTCQYHKWNPGNIRCCKEGYNLSNTTWRCYKVSKNKTTYKEIEKDCLPNGYMMGIHDYERESFVLRHELGNRSVVIREKKDSVKGSLVRCINSSISMIERANLTINCSQSYDDLLDFVRNSTFSNVTPHCSTIPYPVDWAHGQPDGKEEEDCIVRVRESESYKIIDEKCDNIGVDVGFVCYEFFKSIQQH